MKPYLYILAVLLVGGGIGYYMGLKSAEWEKIPQGYGPSGTDDTQTIQNILQRQIEAYNLHDEGLLLRDCSASFVEVNGNTGESLTLDRSLIFHHETFRFGKSVTFTLRTPDIKISRNLAIIRSGYSKTSEDYEKEGFKGVNGEGVWALSRNNGRWQISAFLWTEEPKN
jgi:hypothetical protein